MVYNLAHKEIGQGYKYIVLEKNLPSCRCAVISKRVDEVVFKVKGFQYIRDCFKHRVFFFLDHNRELCCAISDEHYKSQESITEKKLSATAILTNTSYSSRALENLGVQSQSRLDSCNKITYKLGRRDGVEDTKPTLVPKQVPVNLQSVANIEPSKANDDLDTKTTFELPQGMSCTQKSDIKQLLLNISSDPVKEVYLVEDEAFNEIMEQCFAPLNTMKAKYTLDLLSPKSCAKNVNYTTTISCVIMWLMLLLISSPVTFILINNIIYFSHILFRMVILFASMSYDRSLDICNSKELKLPKDEDLPIYTILIPLYQEFYKLKSILRAIDDIDYPKDKMDVKLIIEADDDLILKALKMTDIPSYVHVIKVPFSLPRTKPKALNYAMSYALGEYVVIYDAEDVPERDQLRMAIGIFQALPREYVCLQAKLNFYNAKENILTNLFSLEYGLLFNYLLKGLSLHNMPVPLGGTSNHFKIFVLDEIGGWDAYNVTEDADMGIRLSIRNYKTYVLDSTTYEESPISLSNWMHQRSRWIKGFMQTSIIFLKDGSKRHSLSLIQHISVYIFLCLTPYSFLCVPFMLIASYIEPNSSVIVVTLINTVISLVYLYTTAFIVIRNAPVKYNLISFIIVLLAWPWYFCLHIVASYISIFQSITNPFKWNKTLHGESSIENDFDM